MGFQQFATSFFAGLSILSTATLVFFLWLYRRNEAKEHKRLDQTRTDIADMTILFQTMRDVIKQQKNLAREFNDKLDAKMALVKQVLAKGMEKNEALYERQQDLARQLEAAQAHLQSLQRQIARARVPNVAPPLDNPGSLGREAPRDAPASQQDTVAIRSMDEEPRAARTTAFAEWATLDFDLEAAPAQPGAESEEEPAAEPPHTPEDAQAARDAFRALLDFGGETEKKAALAPSRMPGPPLKPGPEARPTTETTETTDDNGDEAGDALGPVQKRVYEYSQAGMSVAEIAKELGIGKGEVRLMLSLRKQKRT